METAVIWPVLARRAKGWSPAATFALNSAVNRLRVFMMDRPSRRQIHLKPLSHKPGPPLTGTLYAAGSRAAMLGFDGMLELVVADFTNRGVFSLVRDLLAKSIR